MKRLTAGLLALMLLATLLPGCGKKEQWNVDNFFLSDDGTTYSVSYRHDDGTEEVVAEMGSYPQPLTIIAGKLYYVHGGSMVAVDLKDPTQRQTLTEPGLSGLSIGFIDDGAVYCPLATDTEKCYRVALDLSECTRVAIPREQRPTDYDALLDKIYAAVGAIDNRMALRTLRARYSETGSLTSLEMTVWSLQEETYSLNSWADVHVSVQRSGSSFTVSAQDQHRPLPMDSDTVAAMLSVQQWAQTMQAMDQADLWAGQLTGQPLYYELTYHAAEYEAAVAAESVPCLHPDGTAAQLPQGSLLVLAQCYDRGDANITLTDAKGLSVGALRVVVPAA